MLINLLAREEEEEVFSFSPSSSSLFEKDLHPIVMLFFSWPIAFFFSLQCHCKRMKISRIDEEEEEEISFGEKTRRRERTFDDADWVNVLIILIEIDAIIVEVGENEFTISTWRIAACAASGNKFFFTDSSNSARSLCLVSARWPWSTLKSFE